MVVRVAAFGALCASGITTERDNPISEIGTKRFKFIRPL